MRPESPAARRARMGMPPYGTPKPPVYESKPTQPAAITPASNDDGGQSVVNQRLQTHLGVSGHSQGVPADSSEHVSNNSGGTDSTSANPSPASASKRLPELNSLEREFLPPLLEIQETPPSPLPRKLLWTLICLVVVLIIWASVGQISIVSTAPGKFIPAGRVKQVQPLESSVVKAIHVREGQRVEQGDLLLELDTTLTQADFKANADKFTLNQLEQARLRAELTNTKPTYADLGASQEKIDLAEQVRQARLHVHAVKLAQAEAEVAEKASALEAAKAVLYKYQQTLLIAEERESSARPVYEIGVLSKFDYLEFKQALVTNQNDLAAQEKTVKQAEAALLVSQQRLNQVKRDRVADIYDDLSQRVTTASQLKSDLDKARQLDALKSIRSPVSGTIQKIEVSTLGQVVTAAQNLITIVPDDTPLVVEGTLSNQDIGYARVGQEVEIKVDTFPFQKYGTLKGKLIWISSDAEDKSTVSNDADTRSGASNGSNPTASAPTGYVYKVHIQPEKGAIIVDGKSVLIQAGMTVQADITTDHRKVIEFFLSPVVKYLDEGLKVR